MPCAFQNLLQGGSLHGWGLTVSSQGGEGAELDVTKPEAFVLILYCMYGQAEAHWRATEGNFCLGFQFNS